MPPKKNKGGKGKNDDWDDDAAEKKLAKLAVKDESDKEAFSESEEEAPAPKPKNRMAAFQMMSESEHDSDAKQSDDEAPAKEKTPVKAEPKKEKKEKNKKKDKKKDKKEEDDDIDAVLANWDKPNEEKVGKKAKKKEKKAAAGDEEDEAAAPAAEATPEPTAAPAADKPEAAAEGEKADDDGKKKKRKKKKGGKGDDEGEDAEKKEEEEADEAEKPESELTEEEKKKLEKKRKEKEKKKEKEKEKKDKEKKGGKKESHVDMIKKMLREKAEAEEAEAQRIKEEEERYEAAMKAQEEEERIRKEKKEEEKKRRQEKIEAEKKAGTYLTPAQRLKQQQTMAKLAAANIVVTRDEDTDTTGEKPKKRILYDVKKKGKGAQQKDSAKTEEKEKSESPVDSKPATPPPVEQPAAAPAAPAAPAEAAEEEAAWDDEPVDDWEMADEIPVPAAAPTAAVAAPAAETKVAVKAAAPVKEKSGESKEESESSSEESSSDGDSSDEDESTSEEDSSDDDDKKGGKKETKEQIAERVKLRLKKRRELAQSKRSTDDLRAPVICVLGHVDTGKTKMLDTIRRTNVQDGEAGGITQQIGATQVPGDAIKERCKMVRDFDIEKMKIPGFLIIDTPGHESFSNLRNRGSSLCDYAILVVDIMHGLEPQTIESLKMLLKRATPFVIALNKIDRLYGYESNPRKDVYTHLKSQPTNTQLEFTERYNKIVGEFSEQGVNVVLSNKNRNEEEYISMVPTSAFLGDGIGNIMAHIANTTQTRFAEKLAFCEELDASVMEVKAIPGLGTTIDVILVNGRLNEKDIIILTGSDGPIVTQVRGLLMPQPLKEMRVKNEYNHFKQIKGAQGIKILANGLEKALAGLPMFVAHMEDEVEILSDEAEAQLRKALVSIKRKPEGVYVQASTLGSLEALLEFLKSQKIPYSNVSIGPVHRRDVQKAAVMLEKNPEFACILAFDVRIEKDAQQFADKEGVKIFQADIIYHLEDNFLKYREELRLKARQENEHRAIFPCKLRVLPQHVFNARNPIVCGVAIEAGQLKKGTPICVPSKEGILLGAVSSIERNHEQVDLAKQGEEVCIKIENTTGEAPKLYGRHFTHEDALVSKITRDSIDVCKEHFRDDLSKTDWGLVVQLKKLLDIM